MAQPEARGQGPVRTRRRADLAPRIPASRCWRLARGAATLARVHRDVQNGAAKRSADHRDRGRVPRHRSEVRAVGLAWTGRGHVLRFAGFWAVLPAPVKEAA